VAKRSSADPISRGPGGDLVAAKVDVVQMGRVTDQIGQGRSVLRDDLSILSVYTGPRVTDRGAG